MAEPLGHLHVPMAMKKYPLVAKSRYPFLARVKVSTPCSSCRSGTAGPDGDGEGANQSPSTTGEFH